MATKVFMPQLGETVVEGTISKWLVQQGDTISKFDALLEISTDKIDTEVPSPAEGVLLEIYVAEGETVAAGTLIAMIGRVEEGSFTGTEPDSLVDRDHASAISPSSALPHAEAQPAPSRSLAPGKEVGFISPVVAKLAAEYNIDLGQVVGTGLKGRIRKKDILAYIERVEMRPISTGSEHARPVGEPDLMAVPVATDATEVDRPEDQVIPLNRMRRLIAEHMVLSKQTSAHVTTVFDCDLTAVIKHRYANVERFARDGAQLTLTPYFIAAVVAALKQHPYANASWSEAGIVLHKGIHIGVAVATEEGLIVPVIKDADTRNLLGLTRAVNDLADRARSGTLTVDDIQGGTFTLTNHGTSGSLFATPIIHQPQTGILGVGRIHKASVIVSHGHPLLPDAGDTIAIRPIAYLSFSFDHRILDGVTADGFMTSVKEFLESWDD